MVVEREQRGLGAVRIAACSSPCSCTAGVPSRCASQTQYQTKQTVRVMDRSSLEVKHISLGGQAAILNTENKSAT